MNRRKRMLRNVCIYTSIFILAIAGFIYFLVQKSAQNDEALAEPAPENQITAEDLPEIVINVEVEEPPRQINTATEEHHKTNGLAVCMYHYVYDENNPPDEINANYIEVKALEEQLLYLIENDYYFPSWEEVRQYVDGELLLPEKSIVLSFDDGAKSFLKVGAPLFDKYEIPVTSFLITIKDGENKVATYESEFLQFQSHTHNMHRAGGNIGHGGIFPVMPHDEAVADLKESIRICGNGEALAYPYGDYNDSCVAAVKEAGFLCAFTTEYGRVFPGDDPYLLPRIRISHGQSLKSFIAAVE